MLLHDSINRITVQLSGLNLNLKMWTVLPADYQKEGVKNARETSENPIKLDFSGKN
jgi:hypothetical protein